MAATQVTQVTEPTTTEEYIALWNRLESVHKRMRQYRNRLYFGGRGRIEIDDPVFAAMEREAAPLSDMLHKCRHLDPHYDDPLF
jgi:hypothetical protein